MALFFSCPCGQPLREDEDRAGGQVKCPACSRLVRVPSLGRANAAVGVDAAPPLEPFVPTQFIPPLSLLDLKVVESPAENFPPVRRPAREKPARAKDVYDLADRPEFDSTADVRDKIERKKIRRLLAEARADLEKRDRQEDGWPLEQHWYECLIYPLRAMLIVAVLGVAWATLTAFLILILPDAWDWVDFIPRAPLLLFVFVLLGYTFACLQVTYVAALEGHAGSVPWPERGLAHAARAGLQALLCWLAGPAWLALVAFFFWLGSGDLTLTDWLILWELGLIAVGYFALTFLAVTQTNRIGDANPLAIVRLVKRHGWRVLLAAALIAIVVVGHTITALTALEELHRSLGGWLLLATCVGGAIFWMILILRWLGVSNYRPRKKALTTEPRQTHGR